MVWGLHIGNRKDVSQTLATKSEVGLGLIFHGNHENHGVAWFDEETLKASHAVHGNHEVTLEQTQATLCGVACSANPSHALGFGLWRGLR